MTSPSPSKTPRQPEGDHVQLPATATPTAKSSLFSSGGGKIPFGLSPDTTAASVTTGPLGPGLGLGFGFPSIAAKPAVGIKNDTQAFAFEPHPSGPAASRPLSRSSIHHDHAGEGDLMTMMSDHEGDPDDFLPADYPSSSRLSLSAATTAPAARRPPPPPSVPASVKPEFNPDTLLTFPSTETAKSANPDCDPEPEPEPNHRFVALDDLDPRTALAKNTVLSSPSPPPLAHSKLATAIASDPGHRIDFVALTAAATTPSDPPTVTSSSFRKVVHSPPLLPYTTSKNAASSSSSTGRSNARSSSKERSLPPTTSVNPEMLYDTPLLDYMYDSSHTQMPTSPPIARESKPDMFLILDNQPTFRFPLRLGYNILGTKPQPITCPLLEPNDPQHLVALPAHLPGLSRTHAIIHARKDGRVFIHDNKSKNGTFLDPLPSTPHRIRRLNPHVVDLVNPGEHIRLASNVFTLESTTSAPPALPPPRVLTRAPTQAADTAREPTPPGSLTPTPASVARTLSSSSSSSSSVASAARPTVPSSPTANAAAAAADTSTAAQHGSSPVAPPPLAAIKPAATVPGAIERLRTSSDDDPDIQAFLRDLPPITRFERKSSGGAWTKPSLSSPSQGQEQHVLGVGSGPLVLSSQTQRVLAPSSSQVNLNGIGLDEDEDVGAGFRSPGLSPISRISLGSRRPPPRHASSDEGDEDLIRPRPPSSGRPTGGGGGGGGFASNLFNVAARARSTVSPALPPPPASNCNDESLDLMDVDPAAQDSCATTVSRLRFHDGPMSSPVRSSPLAASKRVATSDSAVERTVLSPAPALAPAGMQLPPPRHLSCGSGSGSLSSSSTAALRRKPAQPKRHPSFSVSPEPMDESAGSASEAPAVVSVETKQRPVPAAPLPKAKQSKPATAAAHVQAAIPPMSTAPAKRKRRGSAIPPATAVAAAAAAAAAADSSPADDGSDANEPADDPSLPPAKRTRMRTATSAAAAAKHGAQTVDKSSDARPERKAKVTARSSAGELAAIEAQFNKDLKDEMRKKARAASRKVSSCGRKMEEEGESDFSDDNEGAMDVDEAPQPQARGKRASRGSVEAKVKAGRERRVSSRRKRAVELHVESDSSDTDAGMDGDEEPPAAANKRTAAAAASAGKKTAVGKGKAKAGKSELVASARSTPASTSRRVSSSKSAAAATDPADQDARTYIVLFTGGTKASHEADRALVAKLNGETTDKWQDANVLVVDKVRRTVKFLCSLASGIDIVSPAWLAASKKAKRLVPPTETFALVDREMEAKFGFELSESLERRRELLEAGERVFSGLRFFVCSGTVPVLRDMKEIIAAAGGSLAHSIPGTRAKSEDPAEQGLVAIAGDGVADTDQRKRLVDLGHVLHSAEFVLSGVLKQELDWEAHRVKEEPDAASLGSGRTTRRGKRSG